VDSTYINLKEVWGKSLSTIEKEVSKPNFTTWFKNTAIIRTEDGTVHLAVPNEFVKEWLSRKFHKLILKALVQELPSTRCIEFNIARITDIKNIETKIEKIDRDMPATEELPLRDLYVNKNDNLNARYTFDTFVVGPFNELAYAAAQAILQNPGTLYNPFFVYGATGLGKTHLIEAVGNGIKEKYPDLKVYYTTLERFSMDYISSVQNQGNKAAVFKEKYRKYDVLIMDDIQFIGKMEKTQEELFHLFNTLYDANKQIIFSSDKHPNFIPGLEDRLRSRFSQGMIVDIIEPDFESRMAILKNKLTELHAHIPPEVLEYLATTVRGNIRELEGVLKNVVLQSQVKKKDITLTEVKLVLKNNIQKKKMVSPKEVVRIIANYYNVEEGSIYEKTRRKEIVYARQMIMFILREEFNISYPHIGQELGGKDHTTIIHSYNKIKNEIKVNSTLAQEFEELRNMFK
jgi:chromosomal replication initiator protein